jgi:hypothetical protein
MVERPEPPQGQQTGSTRELSGQWASEARCNNPACGVPGGAKLSMCSRCRGATLCNCRVSASQVEGTGASCRRLVGDRQLLKRYG